MIDDIYLLDCLPSTIMTTCNTSSTSGLPGLPYTPPSVTVVASLFCDIPELSPEMRKTAACAILRSQKIFKNPCETTKNGCLDMMYVELHGLGEAQGVEAKEIRLLENKTHGDLLDAVCSTSLSPTLPLTFFFHRYQPSSTPMEE